MPIFFIAKKEEKYKMIELSDALTILATSPVAKDREAVIFSDEDDKYVICKPYVVEKGQRLVFDKETNEFLVNDQV